jgi:hypothetical protein
MHFLLRSNMSIAVSSNRVADLTRPGVIIIAAVRPLIGIGKRFT